MSANTRAPSTIVTINLTGQTEFNIPFEYLARKYVEVTLLGINRLPLVLNTDFRFVTKTLISLTRPYTADYTQIELRRVTSATERLVDFHDGSILRAYDLNLSQIQTLHVAEEARDLTADTIGVNDAGHLDARGRKIVNVAYAVDGGDVVPLGQLAQWNESALNSALRSENAALTAEAANSGAHAAKDIAVSSATQTAEDRVVTQADAAITTANVTLVEADRVKAEEAARKAEQAAAPSILIFDRLDAVDTAVADVTTEVSTLTEEVRELEAAFNQAPSFCAIAHVGYPNWIALPDTDDRLWKLEGGSISVLEGETDTTDFLLIAQEKPQLSIKKAGLYVLTYTQLRGSGVAAFRRVDITRSRGGNTERILVAGGSSETSGPDIVNITFNALAGDSYEVTAFQNLYYGEAGHNRLTVQRVG